MTTTAMRRRRLRTPGRLGGSDAGTTRRQRRLAASLFLVPALVILGAFVFWPMIAALYLSFTDASGFGSPELVGLDNYARIFGDADICARC